MSSLNFDIKSMLIQNGKTAIACNKCKANDIPHINKSHYTPMFETWLYKVECAHCGSYIKFINEHQFSSGEYK